MDRRTLIRTVGLTGIAGAGSFSGVATGQTNEIPDDAPRIWPTGSDASGGTCLDSRGRVHPATGEGSASWFAYRGCGTWKVFPVTGGETYYIRANADSALLDDISYAIQEREDGEWVTQVENVYGHRPGQTFVDTYTPSPGAGEIRILRLDGGAGIGFYVSVYGAEGSRGADLSGLIEDKQSLIDGIRATTAPFLGPSQSVEVEAQSLLDQLEASGEETPDASREALERMIAAEEVTSAAAEQPREIIDQTVDAAYNATVIGGVEAASLIGGGGATARLMAGGVRGLVRVVNFLRRSLLGGTRYIDDYLDDIARVFEEREEATSTIAEDAATRDEVQGIVPDDYLEPFQELRSTAKETGTDVLFQQYYLDERIEDVDLQAIEAIDTDREEELLDTVFAVLTNISQPLQTLKALDDVYVGALDGIDPAIEGRMRDLEDKLSSGQISPEDPAERETIRDVGTGIIDILTEANSKLLDVISRVSAGLGALEVAVAIGAIAFAIRMRLAGKAILIPLTKLVVEITAVLVAINIAVSVIGAIVGLGYLLYVDKAHVLTVDAIIDGIPEVI